MSDIFTEAGLRAKLRRALTTPGTSSDSLLILADALNTCAAWAEEPEAKLLMSYADLCRSIAPVFAEPRPAEVAEPDTLTASRILIRFHLLRVRDFDAVLREERLTVRMHSLLVGLRQVADAEAGQPTMVEQGA